MGSEIFKEFFFGVCMDLKNKLSVAGMYLAVLAGAMTFSVIIVWCLAQLIPIDVGSRRILLGVVYSVVATWAVLFMLHDYVSFGSGPSVLFGRLFLLH